jgi:hypothetical protein
VELEIFGRQIVIIGAHAPTNMYLEEKDAFWKTTEY